MSRSLCKLSCFLLVILILPLFSPTASAQDGSAELRPLYLDIELFEDGSTYTADTREIVLAGDRGFTCLGVNNFLAGPREFISWQVSIDGTPLLQLDEPDNESRPENIFVVKSGDEKNIAYIYLWQEGSGTRVFQISCQVEDTVKLYSDVGEFFWNLAGENEPSDISALTVILTTSQGILEEEFRIWAYGLLRGTFKKQSDSITFLQMDNVSTGSIVDIRSILPADRFYGRWERQGEMLDEILAEEKELADDANARCEEEERTKTEQETYRAEQAEWEENHPILYFIERLIDEICCPCDKTCNFFLNFMGEIGWNIFCVSVFGLFSGFFIIILPLHGKIGSIL